MIVHSSTGPTSCSGTSTACAASPRARTGPSARSPACCTTVLQMIETQCHACRRGDRSRHRVLSQRLWPGYKTGEGIEPALLAQFHPLEDALGGDGRGRVADGRAGGRRRAGVRRSLAGRDDRVEKVCIWTPDKDLAQCVRDDRVVQVDQKSRKIRNAAGVREKFGVDPVLIPDFLALVGDAGRRLCRHSGYRETTAARLLNQYGPIETFRRLFWAKKRSWLCSLKVWPP